MGALSLGGRPRSLELEQSKDAISASEVKNAVDSGVGEDHEVRRRHKRDANGNRILKVVKRDATEMADVETEKVIQVRRKIDSRISSLSTSIVLETIIINVDICFIKGSTR